MFKAGLCFGIIAVVLNGVLAIPDELRARLQTRFLEIATDCGQTHPLGDGDLGFLKQRIFPEHENAGCFAACVFHRIGLFDDQGILPHASALDGIRQIYEDEEELRKIGEFLTLCGNVNEVILTDRCERAKWAYKCYIENHPKFGFDFHF